MTILAIDTALGAASVCVLARGESTPVAVERMPMARGHDSVLLPLIERVVERSGGFEAIERVAVTVGPGSFTGLRIGIAAAQGIGLARDIPVVGVSTLAAFAAPEIAAGGEDLILASVDARHGRVFFEAFRPDGRSVAPPLLMPAPEVIGFLQGRAVRLVGSAAPLLAIEGWQAGVQATVSGDTTAPDIAFVARLGALADPELAPPRPLYLKEADVTVSARPAPGAAT